MALIINEKYAASATPGWKRVFYVNRALRIYPVYLVVLCICVGVFLWNHSPMVFTDNTGLTVAEALALAVMNALILFQDLYQTVMVAIHKTPHGEVAELARSVLSPNIVDQELVLIGQAWSLASELVFYAIAPFVVRSPLRVLALFCASVTLRWTMVFGLDGYPSANWGYHFLPNTLCFFALGALAYFLQAPGIRMATAHRLLSYALFAGVLCLSILVLSELSDVPAKDRAPYDLPINWVFYAMVAFAIPFLFRLTRRSRIDRALGELSYPLYVVHGIVIGVIFMEVYDGLPTGRFPLVAVAATLAAAAALHLLIERPVDRYRHAPGPAWRRHSRRGGLALGSVLGAVSAVGCASALAVALHGPRHYAPPRLTMSVNAFNLVRFDGRYFAIPHGTPVDWNQGPPDAVPGVRTARLQDDLVRSLAARPWEPAAWPVGGRPLALRRSHRLTIGWQ